MGTPLYLAIISWARGSPFWISLSGSAIQLINHWRSRFSVTPCKSGANPFPVPSKV
ncbi:MAG: hypothetical protein P5681_01505 [Limnospira sp. PMC 894.15]|nr:hypothetical protein [Limnospira sp. PMC 1042.18]MDT9186481.1 hypothetical protein [Limnospira sp. PMC 894.15]MDT9196564.1 hypothetical protein [Limnospira sp. PMC 1042.18]